MLLTLAVALGAVATGAHAQVRFRPARPILRPTPPPPAPPGLDPVCSASATRDTTGLFTCDAFFSGWTYRLQSDDCAAVEFSGCGTGSNFFDSQEECEALCKQVGDADDGDGDDGGGSGGGDVKEEEDIDGGDGGDDTGVCALPLVRRVPPPPGFVTCQAFFSGWSFAARARRCVAVGVSGCGRPVGNFFDSEAACAEACLTD